MSFIWLRYSHCFLVPTMTRRSSFVSPCRETGPHVEYEAPTISKIKVSGWLIIA